jgi:hypothetical protein
LFAYQVHRLFLSPVPITVAWKKMNSPPRPASKHNVTADQYHHAQTCQYAELSSSLSLGAHRLFRVRHRPPALPCPDLKRTTCNSYSYSNSDKFSLSSFDMMGLRIYQRFTWIDRPTRMEPLVLIIIMMDACAFFISTVFIHCFPSPLSIPPSHVLYRTTPPPNLLLGAAAYI